MIRIFHIIICTQYQLFPLVAAEVPKKDVAETFRLHYYQLSKTLKPDDITAKLYSTGLISQADKGDIEVTGQSLQHKTAKLLDAVERAINAEPNNFYTFLKVLNRHQIYKRLVQNIIMDHGEMFFGANDCTCNVIVLHVNQLFI